MAINTTPIKWNTYNPQQLERVSYAKFQGSGIDTFTDPTAQDPKKFFQLENVLPAINGGFNRRWGISTSGNTFDSAGLAQRLFSYAASADVTDAGTQDCSIIIGTDGFQVKVIYNELNTAPITTITTFPDHTPGGGPVYFSSDLYGATSRGYFYAMNGLTRAQKVNYSQRSYPTAWNMGIDTPVFDTSSPSTGGLYTVTPGVTGRGNGSYGIGSGLTTPVGTVTGGGGSGCTVTFVVQSGLIIGMQITNPGTGYTTPPTLTVTDPMGTVDSGVQFLLQPDTDTTSATVGQIISWTVNGPYVLNGGRIFGLAFQNDITGHTSDFLYGNFSAHNSIFENADDTFAAGSFLGATRLILTIGFKTMPTDSQVTTAVIIASGDGGDVEHMYEYAIIPLSDFVLNSGSGFFEYTINDTLPDTYNDLYMDGPTLLTKNLWVDTDAFGNIIGIAENTPPPVTLTKPILHKNRFFATDGKSVYFSKSLGEVTTGTGLITSKFEEAWPGDNVLDIAYGNEHITALLSDGETLYIGTTENIYRLLGSSAQDFTIPAAVFRGVGVSGQDTWSVVYKDNIPAGYMWCTPDNKIMMSDFNSYEEIGAYIYNQIETRTITAIQSVSYGPYSLVFLGLNTASGSQLTNYVYDTKTSGWYKWDYFPNLFTSTTVYRSVLLNYTNAQGLEKIYVNMFDITGAQYLNYFDPNSTQDAVFGTAPASPISWIVQTNWQDLGDPTALKVLNEIELWTSDLDTKVTIAMARTPSELSSSRTLGPSPFVTGPVGTQKYYVAGSSTQARYYVFQFGTAPNTTTSTSREVLSAFSVEFFPIGRL